MLIPLIRCSFVSPLRFSSVYHLHIPAHLVSGSILRALSIIVRLVAPQVDGLSYVRNYSDNGK